MNPKRVEYNYPPKPWRKSEEGNLAFMEMYNVTHVVTYQKRWIRYCDERPHLFRKMITLGKNLPKHVYEVQRDPDIFLEGSGTVDAGINRIDVTLEDPEAPAVIRYHWDDRLSANAPARIQAHDMGNDIQFIAIEPNGQSDIHIRYRRWL